MSDNKSDDNLDQQIGVARENMRVVWPALASLILGVGILFIGTKIMQVPFDFWSAAAGASFMLSLVGFWMFASAWAHKHSYEEDRRESQIRQRVRATPNPVGMTTPVAVDTWTDADSNLYVPGDGNDTGWGGTAPDQDTHSSPDITPASPDPTPPTMPDPGPVSTPDPMPSSPPDTGSAPSPGSDGGASGGGLSDGGGNPSGM